MAGKVRSVVLEPLGLAMQPKAGLAMSRSLSSSLGGLVDVLRRAPRLASRLGDEGGLAIMRSSTGQGVSKLARGGVMTLATPTLIAEGLHAADFEFARNVGGRIIEEGLDGKSLLKTDTIEGAFALARALLDRGAAAASPNFIRVTAGRPRSTRGAEWAHKMIRVRAAWKMTRGREDVRVAILDEGVDTLHEALRAAVFAQRDFIGEKGDSAMPDNDDAHGTNCAGVVLSRDAKYPGIAPDCSLIAARIAVTGDNRKWIMDDYSTADAIDWCRRSGADVLSNSWAGGEPSEAVSLAFGRARSQGRGGMGCVVCLCASNEGVEIPFPGDLRGYVTVGASNHLDQRKTFSSADGEDGWASCFGPSLSLLAPGVFIRATDIEGTAGEDPGDFFASFNGTSAATPHVAATAALMLSINPGLSAPTVRDLLGQTAKPIGKQKGWNERFGHGRLDVAKAVSAAASAG